MLDPTKFSLKMYVYSMISGDYQNKALFIFLVYFKVFSIFTGSRQLNYGNDILSICTDNFEQINTIIKFANSSNYADKCI